MSFFMRYRNSGQGLDFGALRERLTSDVTLKVDQILAVLANCHRGNQGQYSGKRHRIRHT